MTIRKPKLISTQSGLGLGATTKQLSYQGQDHAILTEVWQKTPGGPRWQGKTIIASPGYIWISDWQVGQPYVAVQFFTAGMQLVGTYIDITIPVHRTRDGFEYDGLYLRIWRLPGKKPELLGENELEGAVAMDYLAGEDAGVVRDIAKQIMKQLSK